MIPLLLAVAGALALGIAGAILRSFGPRYRVGRLLAVAPRVSIAEAVRIAEAGETAYIRVDGRIDSDEEFEDEAHRPLVLRRTAIQWRPAPGSGGHAGDDSWRPAGEPEVELAPFVVREGLDEIEVGASAIADGLVVVPRISVGTVRDLGERAPAGVTPDAEARLQIEQVSSVEHAAVLGVPARGADGHVVMGPGLGRPLILSTLERDEAMRVLTGGATGRARVAIACFVVGVVLLGVAAIWFVLESLLGTGVAVALAESPDPTLRPGGDTRTPGANPGFVGEPMLAILGVLALGIGALLATLAYIRLSGGRGSTGTAPPRRR